MKKMDIMKQEIIKEISNLLGNHIEIRNLQAEIFELKKKVYQLENPFKFKIGDEVTIKDSIGTLTIGEDLEAKKIVYKIVESNWREDFDLVYSYPPSNKYYDLFDCKNSEKKTEWEYNIKLYKGENKK